LSSEIAGGQQGGSRGWWLACSVQVRDITAQFPGLPQTTAVTFHWEERPDLLRQLGVVNGIHGATPQLLSPRLCTTPPAEPGEKGSYVSSADGNRGCGSGWDVAFAENSLKRSVCSNDFHL